MIKLGVAVKFFFIFSVTVFFANEPLFANAAGYRAVKQCYVANIGMAGWFRKFSTDTKSVKFHEERAARFLQVAVYEAPFLKITGDEARNDLLASARTFIAATENRLGIGNARGLGEFFNLETETCAKWLRSQ